MEAALRAAPVVSTQEQTLTWVSVGEALPRSGHYVLAAYENRADKTRVVRAMYVGYRSMACECEDADDCGCEAGDEEFIRWWPEGWHEIADNAENCSYISDTVTHWMPLPTHPSKLPAPVAESPTTNSTDSQQEANCAWCGNGRILHGPRELCPGEDFNDQYATRFTTDNEAVARIKARDSQQVAAPQSVEPDAWAGEKALVLSRVDELVERIGRLGEAVNDRRELTLIIEYLNTVRSPVPAESIPTAVAPTLEQVVGEIADVRKQLFALPFAADVAIDRIEKRICELYKGKLYERSEQP